MTNLTLTVLGSNQSRVNIGDRTFYFSYDTCVAYSDAPKHIYLRRDRNYSVTTAKHMGQMGVKNWTQVCDDEFERAATIL